MNYILTPVKVSIAFYTYPGLILKPLIKILGKTDIHHCSLVLEREDNRIVLATSDTHRAKFVDEDMYHSRIITPICIVDIGKSECSINQLNDFIKPYSKLNKTDLIYYCILGRFLSPSSLTTSCSLITCQLIRIMGYNINDYVLPRDLYLDLKKEHKERSYECSL